MSGFLGKRKANVTEADDHKIDGHVIAPLTQRSPDEAGGATER
jgi:hypothetical protein